MGRTLTHEHALVDFVGAAKTQPDNYDLEEAFDVVRPHLEQIRDMRCRTLVDCTPAYIGRSLSLLVRLARETGLHMLSNTGMSHTGPTLPAFEQLGALEEEGVAPEAWIWTHAQRAQEDADLLRAAQRGAWVALDGLRDDNIAAYVARILAFTVRKRPA